MKKEVLANINLADKCLHAVMEKKISNLPSGYDCKLNPDNNSVLPSINGNYFKTTCLDSEVDDALILEDHHNQLPMKVLEAFGTVFHIEDNVNGWDFMNFGVNPLGADIKVETTIEFAHVDFKGKNQESIHNELMSYLGTRSDVDVIDDGNQEIVSYEVRFDIPGEDPSDPSNWRRETRNFGEIWIEINVGQPKVVANLKANARKIKTEIEAKLNHYINK